MTEPAPRRRHSGTFDPTGAITAQGDAANDLARFGGSVTGVGEATASRSVVVLGGAVALVVVTLLLGAVAISIRAEFDAAQERSRFDTGVVESNVTKTLEAVETSLLTVARQFGEGGAVRSVSARVDALEAANEALAFSPTMRQIVVAVADRVVVDTAERSIGASLDEDRLRLADASPVDPRSQGLRIMPVLEGRYLPLVGDSAERSMRSMLPVALEVGDVRVVAALNPMAIVELIEPVSRNGAAGIAVVGLDGRVLFGPQVDLPEKLGAGVAEEALLLVGGAYVAGRVSSRYPLAIVARTERLAVVGGWVRSNAGLLTGVVFSAFALVGVIAILTLQAVRRGRVLAEQLQSLFQAAERASSALVVTDGAFNVVYGNQAYVALLGPLEGEALDALFDRVGLRDVQGQPIGDLLRADGADASWTAEATLTPEEQVEIRLRVSASRTELGAMRDAWVLSIENVSELHRQRLALQEANMRLRRLASEDPLTGIANRRTFFARGASEVYRARRYAHPLALMLVDLDHFKQVNDTFGHPVGDRVLQRFAEELASHLRRSDVAARIGGEEFAVLLPETSMQEALVIAEKVRALTMERLQEVDGHAVGATVSIGLTMWRGGEELFETVVSRADEALYVAKDNGRNRVVELA